MNSNSMEGKDMLETMKTNWKQICEQLNCDSELAPAAGEKKVLLKVEKIECVPLSLKRYVSHNKV
jgi:hypothetical protein